MCKTGVGCSCPHKAAKAVGLLALRLIAGLLFIYEGYGKVFAHHMGATGMMMGIGLPGPSFWAYFVGAVEIIGGIMLILGIFTRYAAAILAFVLLVALLTVHRHLPLEAAFYPLALLGGMLSLMGTGAGRYRLVECECCCPACKAGGKMGGNCSCGKADCKECGTKQDGCACGGAGACGCGSNKMEMMGKACDCKGCCGGKCACGAPNGQCSCCAKK